ncbi:hypothetical protein ACROYT_G023870 [Oculina patagonica]
MSPAPASTLFTTLSNLSANTTTSAPAAPFQVNPSLGLVVEVVILLLVFGHVLIITTLCLYKPWNIADLLLFSLSVADAVNAAIPLQMLNLLNNFIGPHLWTRASCAVFVILTYTFRIASVCTITLISGDRAILLTRPLQHHVIVTIGRARIAVVAIWLFSIFMSILPFIGVGKSGYRDGYCFYQLFDFGVAYGYIIESIGILQLIIVLVCFIAIKLSSLKFVKRQSTMAAARQTGGKNQQARETAGTRQVKQMSTMMAIVVVLYYISWLPYLLINLYSMVTGQINHRQVIIIGFCSLVNALINPILYGKMSLRYRQGYMYIFKRILSLCGAEKPDGSFFDATRRAASMAKRLSAPTVSYNATTRKSLDITNEDGGFQRTDSSARRAGVRFEVNNKREENNEEDRTNSTSNLIEDGNANFKNLDTSSLQVSLQSEDQETKETDAEYTTLDESFDSAL